MLANAVPTQSLEYQPTISIRLGVFRQARLLAKVLSAACFAVTLGACNSAKSYSGIPFRHDSSRPDIRKPIPLPRSALLKPQPAPNCTFKPTEPSAQSNEASTDDRPKLDYERQCYRHAEMIARERLQLLQASVRRMAKAVDRCQWAAGQPSGLRPLAANGTLTQ